MRNTVRITVVFVFCCVLSTLALADAPREIMRRVFDRDDGETQISRVKLSTCRYSVENRKIKCAESPRVKVMEEVRKDYGDRGEDTKMVVILREPVAERGIAFLQYDYDDQTRETDQWMYFSALNKVKRIVPGSENEPKTGSFFGTEMNYEDVEPRHLENYDYRFLAEEAYRGRSCWVVESLPTPAQLKRSNYGKIWDWVDKERDLILKTILHDRRGRRVKRIIYSDVERVDGVWIARGSLVNGLVSRRLTAVTLSSVVFNTPVSDSFLTQRTLTDMAFRERLLRAHRSHVD